MSPLEREFVILAAKYGYRVTVDDGLVFMRLVTPNVFAFEMVKEKAPAPVKKQRPDDSWLYGQSPMSGMFMP